MALHRGGQMVAGMIVDGYSEMDVTGYLPARLQPFQAAAAYRDARVVESLEKVYKCHYPNRPVVTARARRESALLSPIERMPRLAFKVAVSKSKGWDSPRKTMCRSSLAGCSAWSDWNCAVEGILFGVRALAPHPQLVLRIARRTASQSARAAMPCRKKTRAV